MWGSGEIATTGVFCFFSNVRKEHKNLFTLHFYFLTSIMPPPPIGILSSIFHKFFKKFAILDKMAHSGHPANCTICGEKEKASVNRNLHSQISLSVAFDAVKQNCKVFLNFFNFLQENTHFVPVILASIKKSLAIWQCFIVYLILIKSCGWV